MKRKCLTIFIMLITLVLLIAGCKQANEQEIENDPSSASSEQMAESRYESSDASSDTKTESAFTPPSEDSESTISWQIGNVTYVYYHNGDKVTGFETYIECATEAEAEKMVNEYDPGSDQENGIESVVQKGKYICVTYNSQGYIYATAEEVKRAQEIINGIE